jgi:hypothetical protein
MNEDTLEKICYAVYRIWNIKARKGSRRVVGEPSGVK